MLASLLSLTITNGGWNYGADLRCPDPRCRTQVIQAYFKWNVKVPTLGWGRPPLPRGGPKLTLQEVPRAPRFFFLGQIGYGEEDGTGPGTWGPWKSCFSSHFGGWKSPKKIHTFWELIIFSCFKPWEPSHLLLHVQNTSSNALVDPKDHLGA